MTAMTLADFRSNIRTMLGATSVIYPDADIDRAVSQATLALSRYFPRERIAEFASVYTQQITDESVENTAAETAIALPSALNGPILRGTVTVTSEDGLTTYTDTATDVAGADYTIDYIAGTITFTSTAGAPEDIGTIAEGTTVLITYQRDPNTINISSIVSKLLRIERVYAYKSGEQNISEIQGYDLFGNYLRLISDDERRIQDDTYIRLRYLAAHDVATATVAGSCPEYLDELVLVGAAGYALLTEAAERENQAVTDLATARTRLGNIAAIHTTFTTLHGLADTALVAAVTALALGKGQVELSGKTITTEVDAAVAALASLVALDVSNTITSGLSALGVGSNSIASGTVDLARIDADITGDIAQLNPQLTELSTLVDTIDTDVSKVSQYLEQATDSAQAILATIIAAGNEIPDIATALDKVTTHLTSVDTVLDPIDVSVTGDTVLANTALAKVDTEILTNSTGTSAKSADDYLDTGDALIPSINTADNVPENYRAYAELKLGIAARFIEEAQAHAVLAQTRALAAAQYNNIAGTYIQEAQARATSAQLKLGAVAQYISVAETFIASDRLLAEQAAAKFNLVQAHLVKMQRSIESANAAIDGGNAYANIAAGYNNAAAILVQQGQVKVNAALGYFQAAEYRYRSAQAYFEEATGHINNTQSYLQQIDRDLSRIEAYMTEATVLQNNSSQERLLVETIRTEANARLRDFFQALADRSQINSHPRSIAVRQYAR